MLDGITTGCDDLLCSVPGWQRASLGVPDQEHYDTCSPVCTPSIHNKTAGRKLTEADCPP
jgi:hypothetical protein